LLLAKIHKLLGVYLMSIKTLSVLIPTYNRVALLQKAVESVSTQIDKFGLEQNVDIIICNDRSPDDTESYLETLKSPYITIINRSHNLGMSANILTALTENCQSEWVLIITDDDTLDSDVLPTILDKCQQMLVDNVSICLTPRYSYLSTGELHCIECKSFRSDTLIKPSPSAAGALMLDGFILSGILLQPSKVDYSLWRENIENAMFPVILTGATLRREYGYYWSNKIVSHTVLNECFWNRWGKTEADREYRIFKDWIESYAILAEAYRSSANEYNQFWQGANPQLQRLYSSYLFAPAGMNSLIEFYGIQVASDLVAKTIFCSNCFWSIFLALISIKSIAKSTIKSILLFQIPTPNLKVIVATILILKNELKQTY
jgi:glycosyltransferase involved in cell wall biosynthesis